MSELMAIQVKHVKVENKKKIPDICQPFSVRRPSPLEKNSDFRPTT